MLAPEHLERYADAIVLHCLDLREDERLVVLCELGHRELAVALAAAAYRAGAREVDVAYVDLGEGAWGVEYVFYV